MVSPKSSLRRYLVNSWSFSDKTLSKGKEHSLNLDIPRYSGIERYPTYIMAVTRSVSMSHPEETSNTIMLHGRCFP